jgi:hypothetical protein
MPLQFDAMRLSLAMLAVYRLAVLFACDDGPLFIFREMRRAVGRWAAKETASKFSNAARLSAAELVNCPFCLGVWFAALLAPLVALPTLPGDLFLLWLGLAGAQQWLQVRR